MLRFLNWLNYGPTGEVNVVLTAESLEALSLKFIQKKSRDNTDWHTEMTVF